MGRVGGGPWESRWVTADRRKVWAEVMPVPVFGEGISRLPLVLGQEGPGLSTDREGSTG